MTFALLIILLISSLWTILVLRSAIVSLHQAGKTEEEIKLAERLRAETAGMQPEEAMEKLLNDMAEHETNEGWSSAEGEEAPTENE